MMILVTLDQLNLETDAKNHVAAMLQTLHRAYSTVCQSHSKFFPRLLKDLILSHTHQGWASAICYILMVKGFLYLVTGVGWHSRKVLS
jgi:hypothetical protein